MNTQPDFMKLAVGAGAVKAAPGVVKGIWQGARNFVRPIRQLGKNRAALAARSSPEGAQARMRQLAERQLGAAERAANPAAMEHRLNRAVAFENSVPQAGQWAAQSGNVNHVRRMQQLTDNIAKGKRNLALTGLGAAGVTGVGAGGYALGNRSGFAAGGEQGYTLGQQHGAQTAMGAYQNSNFLQRLIDAFAPSGGRSFQQGQLQPWDPKLLRALRDQMRAMG